MVPASDIGKGSFNPNVGFDEARDLLHAAAEVSRVLSARGGRIGALIDGVDELQCFECFFTLSHELSIGRRSIYSFQNFGCVVIVYLELLKVVHGHGASEALQRAWHL